MLISISIYAATCEFIAKQINWEEIDTEWVREMEYTILDSDYNLDNMQFIYGGIPVKGTERKEGKDNRWIW